MLNSPLVRVEKHLYIMGLRAGKDFPKFLKYFNQRGITVNSFDLNKIALALLLTLLGFMGMNGLSETIFHDEPLKENAFPIEVADSGEADTAHAAAPVDAGPTLAELLSTASADKGMSLFKKCKACHTTDQGGRNLVGPNLWNVVDRAKGSLDSYKYSGAMKAKGGVWDYADMDAFLKKPSAFVAKTKMSFAGMKKATDRAAMIAYLRTLSDTPAALPEVAVVVEEVVVEDAVEEAVEE